MKRNRTRRKGAVTVPDPAASIRAKIPPPGTMLGREDWPVQLWAYLFAATLEDLQRIDPHRAELRWRDFQDVMSSWALVARDWPSSKQWPWLVDVFRELRSRGAARFRRGFKTTGRAFSGPSDRWLLMARQLVKDDAWGPTIAGNAQRRMQRVPRHKLSYPKSSNPLSIWADFFDAH